MGWLLLYLLFSAVYIDVDGTSVFASRMLKLGSREHDPGYMERLVDTLIASDFVGMRDGKPEWAVLSQPKYSVASGMLLCAGITHKWVGSAQQGIVKTTTNQCDNC